MKLGQKSLTSRGGAMPSLSTVKTFSQSISAAPMLGPGSCLSYSVSNSHQFGYDGYGWIWANYNNSLT